MRSGYQYEGHDITDPYKGIDTKVSLSFWWGYLCGLLMGFVIWSAYAAFG